MLDISGLITVALAFFIAAASPGPATIAASSVAMSAGRNAGLKFGLGLSIGLAFWGIVAAVGLGAVLVASTHVLTALKIIGGVYLLWLAYQSARSAAQEETHIVSAKSTRRHFWRGLILNLSNPKAVLAWMAVLALGFGNESGLGQVIASTIICASLGFVIYSSYAMVFSTPRAMSTYRKSRRYIEGVVAGLFAIAGFGLIRSAFTRG